MKTAICLDIDVDCDFEYEPAERATLDCPGNHETATLLCARAKGVDITGLLEPDQVETLQATYLENLHRAQEAAADAFKEDPAAVFLDNMMQLLGNQR